MPPLPLQSCDSWMFVKENPDKNKKKQTGVLLTTAIFHGKSAISAIPGNPDKNCILN